MAIAPSRDILTRRMTEDEFLRLPDDGHKYELVDGEAKEVPAGHRHDIEIISPSEELTEMERKVKEYFDSGAQLVWQLFPDTQQVKVFTSPTRFRWYDITGFASF